MNERQKLFAQEWIKDMNGTQAAIRAGYAVSGAHVQANELLNNPKVMLYIKTLMDRRARVIAIDAEYVLDRLAQIDAMDVADILHDDGRVKPIKEWPKIWRQYLSAVQVEEIAAGSGDIKRVYGVLKKIKWPDKLKNLELLGKHVGVGAFRDRVEVTGKDGGPVEVAQVDASNLPDDVLEALMAARRK